MKNSNLVITRGLGFIGSTIVNQYLENNNTIIHNLSTGKLSNIENIEHKNLNLIESDIKDLE